MFYHSARRRWVGRVIVGRSAKGHTAYREVSGHSHGEVVRKLSTLAKPDPVTCTLRQWGERWLLDLAHRRPATREAYTYRLREKVLPTLGHVRLGSLTAYQIEQAAAGWSLHDKPNSVVAYLGALRACLSAAVRAGVLSASPMKQVRKPRVPRTTRTVYTPAELSAVIEEAAGLPTTRIFALLASCGCRIGEALALDVSDFDAATATVAITKTVARGNTLGPPKSERGTRTVRVPAAALPVLVAAAGGRKAGALFTGWGGKRQKHPAAHAAWVALVKRLAIPYRPPHALRHAVASHLLAAGVPLADVAQYLGDSIQTVLNTYVHAANTVDPAAALDRVLGAGKVSAPPPGRGKRKKS